jgi:hypothetical protein
VTNKRWKTIEELAYLMKVINYVYSKILNKKLKAQAEHFVLECQNGFRKDRSCIDPLFSTKLLIEKRKLNLETRLTFLECVKAFYNVKRDKLFEILKSKNISNLF